jgi:hypothetical protein
MQLRWGFVTHARVQRKAEEGAANKGVEWIRQWADTMMSQSNAFDWGLCSDT